MRAASGDRANGTLSSRWDLRVAYDVARGGKGRAFRQFEQGAVQGTPDFSLRNGWLRVESHHCKHEITGDNSLRFRVLNENFDLTVTGFDDRDLVIELFPAATDSDADSAEPLA